MMPSGTYCLHKEDVAAADVNACLCPVSLRGRGHGRGSPRLELVRKTAAQWTGDFQRTRDTPDPNEPLLHAYQQRPCVCCCAAQTKSPLLAIRSAWWPQTQFVSSGCDREESYSSTGMHISFNIDVNILLLTVLDQLNCFLFSVATTIHIFPEPLSINTLLFLSHYIFSVLLLSAVCMNYQHQVRLLQFASVFHIRQARNWWLHKQ